MKKLRFYGSLALALLLALAFVACDSGSGTGKAGTGDDGIVDDRPIETYTATKNNVTYTLVTGPANAKAKAVHLPGDFYTLTAKKGAGELDSEGTVVDFEANVFTLQPSVKDAPSFTITVNGTKISNISGTITYSDDSTEKGPGAFTTGGGGGGGNGTGTGTGTGGSVSVTGVSLNKPATSINVGGTETLTATVTPSNATNKSVTWTSSNALVATVSSTGLVTGVAVGTADITVTTSDGGKTATCAVTVNPAGSYGISLSASGTHTFTTAAVGYGAQTPLTVTVTNTGTLATGALTVALSGTNAGSFALSATSLATITSPGTATFTVGPNTGLAAATYTAIVTVSGANVTSQTFNLSFTVSTATGTPDTSWYSAGPSSFTLTNADELAGLAVLVNAGNNFSGKTVNLSGNLDLSSYANWTPISTYSIYRPFRGTFDGGGRIISNLTITASTADYQGLFGWILTDGVVKNLTLSSVYITGYETVGGVAGRSEGAVENCSVSGSVTGGGAYVGGVVGLSLGTVENCSVSGSVTGGGAYVGGMAGRSEGAVENCSVSGSVTGQDYVGGVVGGNSSTVENCYSGSVIGGRDYVGGVVGSNSGTVGNCYSTGSVISGRGRIGGVVGGNSGTVENCVALSPSIIRSSGSSSYFGRVVGINVGTHTNNYARADMAFINESSVSSTTFPNSAPANNANDLNGASVSSGAGSGQYNNSGFWTTASPSGPGWTLATNKAAATANAAAGVGSPWYWGGSLPVLWFE